MELTRLEELGEAAKKLMHKDANEHDGWSFPYEVVRDISEQTKWPDIDGGFGFHADMEEVDNVLKAIVKLYAPK